MQPSTTTSTTTTTPSWAELLGSDNWSNLLDPLDLSLRRLILQCGDLCQVTYDAFISDPHSRYCGASRYGKRILLSKTHFPSAADLTVADFLYATSDLDLPIAFLYSLSREAWSRESNWIGYVAVSSDSAAITTRRRDIYVAWRGTIRDLEWRDVLEPELVPLKPLLASSAADNHDEPKVMKGWHTIYTTSDPKSPFNKSSARDQLLSTIKQLVRTYSGESLSIVCVGHSLGASLAILSAFDIVSSGLSRLGENDHFPVCAVVFGSPQIGNKAFNENLNKQPKLRVLHVKNKIDLIPLYPTGLLGYVDTGTDLVVDGRKSPYLKDSKNPSDWHNLQGILHAVAGWDGDEKAFELKVKRSLALVNKSSEYLKDECLAPGSWWVEKNKGMVVRPGGEWELAPLDPDNVPIPPGSSTTLSPKTDGDHGAGAKKKEPSRSGFFKLATCFCVADH